MNKVKLVASKEYNFYTELELEDILANIDSIPTCDECGNDLGTYSFNTKLVESIYIEQYISNTNQEYTKEVKEVFDWDKRSKMLYG